MDEQSILFHLELMRAWGVDFKTPIEEVFSEQLRPRVEYYWENIAQVGNQPVGSPAVKVEVPSGQRWLVQYLIARGFADTGQSGGDSQDYILSLYDGKAVGLDAPPKRTGTIADIRTALARKSITTQSQAAGVIAEEWEGFEVFIGYGQKGDGAGGFRFETQSPLMLYAGQQLFLNRERLGTWKSGDQLEVRARYLVFPEHLLNFIPAQRVTVDPGTPFNPGEWTAAKNGAF